MVSEKKDGVWENIKTVIYAVLIALTVRSFAYEPFEIPSGSMIPTLLVGDYLFVSKLSYGYSKHSLPFSPPIFDGRVFEDMPERGDVAVFKNDLANGDNYIKRIVGLPGDSIQVIQGVLHINGAPVRRERIADFVMNEGGSGAARKVPSYTETLPNGRSYRIIEMLGDQGSLDNTQLYQVPEGHVFGMGDNRDGSQDSRMLQSVGYIPIENLVGRADRIFFSLEGGGFFEFWRWPFDLRFNRFFEAIE